MHVPLVYYATVVSTKDPRSLGRVQVKLRGFPADVEMKDVWLRMLTPHATNQSGFVFLPEEGDEVAVLRAADDNVDAMLILGAVYNGKSKPKYSNSDGKNITKEIRTKAGNAITLTDKSGEESVIITTAKAKITVSMENKTGGLVTITGADKVKVDAKTEIAIESNTVKITAKQALELAGKVSVKVEGSTVNVSGKAVDVKGDGKVAISGGMVQIG